MRKQSAVQEKGIPRFEALDGLRGLAAFIVLIHHAMLTSPAISEASTRTGASDSLFIWFVTYTPLHIFWAGSEAVFVFFLLSGFVLALPFMRSSHRSWRSYYPMRLARLYLPVWGSILFAIGMTLVVPRVAADGLSPWVNSHAEPISAIADATLVLGTGWLNSPLWSLQWEVLFSLVLPLYLFIAHKIGRFWIVALAGLMILIGVGSVLVEPGLIYLPMFGIGVLLALRKDELLGWATSLPAWIVHIVAILSVLLLTIRWTFPQLAGSTVLATCGGIFMLVLFLFYRPAVKLGTLAPIIWLGKRSFSLYLVHEPIIVSVSMGLHLTNPLLVLAISAPLALAVTEVFSKFIEGPSHSFAKSLGRLSGPSSLSVVE